MLIVCRYSSLSAKEKKQGLQINVETGITQHQNNCSQCRFFLVQQQHMKHPNTSNLTGKAEERTGIFPFSTIQGVLAQMILCWFRLLCGTRCLSTIAVPLTQPFVFAYLIATPSWAPEQLFTCFVFFLLCKDFLRNIPGSILSSQLCDKWVSVMDQGNNEEKIKSIQRYSYLYSWYSFPRNLYPSMQNPKYSIYNLQLHVFKNRY